MTQDKFLHASNYSSFLKLEKLEQEFIKTLAGKFRLTFQEIRQVIDIAADFKSWQLPALYQGQFNAKIKEQLLEELKHNWKNERDKGISYNKSTSPRTPQYQMVDRNKKKLGLGHCPVNSPRTRCCQLYTLDAVDNCGQDCSYCSIQSFFKEDKVFFDPDFAKKLDQLELDPQKNYHIGTGQSSDSLMWGNQNQTLSSIFRFAKKWRNTIVELKSKSSQIDYLLENPIPTNVITTWSLNPQSVIDNEEHGTSSLKERLEAAKQVSNKGNLIGFHFHPMIHYSDWQKEYHQIFEEILKKFTPSQVAMISFGTLTYTKSIIKKIRARDIETKVLQIPFEEIEGKFSYPFKIKEELFKFAYNSFLPWHDKVFFYLCMEDINLWQPVFGFEFRDNDHFEQTMFESYQQKIMDLKIL